MIAVRHVFVWGAMVVCLPVVLDGQSAPRLGSRVGGAQAGAYAPGTRRDPFASLMVEAPPEPTPTVVPRAPGLAGLALVDVRLKGIVVSGAPRTEDQTFLALIAGPVGVTYLARLGDRLHDAVIRRIDSEGVVFLAQVADESGATRGREIRKTLRPSTRGRR